MTAGRRNFFKMKKLIFVAILATLCFYLGCNKAEYQETSPATEVSDDATPNPNGGAITTRSHCGAITECEITVTTDVDATLEVCGDVPIGTSTCPYADCNGDPGIIERRRLVINAECNEELADRTLDSEQGADCVDPDEEIAQKWNH